MKNQARYALIAIGALFWLIGIVLIIFVGTTEVRILGAICFAIGLGLAIWGYSSRRAR